METKIIKNKSGKELAQVNLILDYSSKNPKNLINELVDKTDPINEIGYAGFRDKEWLKGFLEMFVFGRTKSRIVQGEFNKDDIGKTAEDAINKCMNFLEEKIYIFFYPIFDSFVKEKMNGSSGFCVYKKTIICFINPEEINYQSIKSTIIHELVHAVNEYYNMGDMTIGQGFVFDGIAEHFQEMITKQKNPWAHSISKQDARNYFEELKPNLDNKNFDFYSNVFFGTGKYPLWTGYAIGYYLIENYLKNKKTVDWNKLIRKNPKEILDSNPNIL